MRDRPGAASVDRAPRGAADGPFGLIWTPRAAGPGARGSLRWFDRMLGRSLELGFVGAYLVEGPADLAELPQRIEAADRIASAGARFFVTLPSPHGPPGAVVVEPTPPDALAALLAPLVKRGHPVFLELRAGDRPAALGLPSTESLVGAAASSGLGWGLAFRGAPATEELEAWLERGPAYVRWPANLLSPRDALDRVAILRRRGTWLLADDPFDSGRLDGSRLRGSPLSVPGPPEDLAGLQREWAPVLARRFLTADGRRTLAGAALRFLRDTPGVGGVTVGAEGTDELEAVARAWDSEPLTLEELDRLRGLAPLAPGPTAARGDKIPPGR